jgi:hypothetical protein
VINKRIAPSAQPQRRSPRIRSWQCQPTSAVRWTKRTKTKPQEILAAPRSRRRASLSATIRCSPTSSGIQTVAAVGSNKYFALAGAHVALANKI